MGRQRLDLLIANLGRRAADRSVASDVDTGSPVLSAAGLLAARAVLDAGIDIGFGHWIHSASVALLDTRLDGTDLTTAITDRETCAEARFRTVTVAQGNRPLARGQISFEAPLLGAYQEQLTGIGDTPDPHSVQAVRSSARPAELTVDIRPMEGRDRTWFRYHSELPDDLLVHAAALALTVDCVIAHGLRDVGDYRPISYALWIHRCFRADDWILATAKITQVFGNRAFLTYTLSSSHGREIATAAQEVRLLHAGDSVDKSDSVW